MLDSRMTNLVPGDGGFQTSEDEKEKERPYRIYTVLDSLRLSHLMLLWIHVVRNYITLFCERSVREFVDMS
jgi:hypothetical protein